MKKFLSCLVVLIVFAVQAFCQETQDQINFAEIVSIFERNPELNQPLLDWFQEAPEDPRSLIILALSSSEKLHEIGLIDRLEAVLIAFNSDDFLAYCDAGLAPYFVENELRIVWIVPASDGTCQVIVDASSGERIGQREMLLHQPMERASSARRQAVVREANYALRGADGNVGKTYNGCYAGDWDYVNSNPSVRNTAASKYIPGTYGRDQFGYGLGGYCKFFVGIVVRRGTGDAWIPSNQTLWNNGSHAKYTKSGHVLQKNPTSPHTAIVIAILCYDSSGYVTGADVIDSNYIRSWTIGQHPLYSNGSGFSNLYNYRTWSSY